MGKEIAKVSVGAVLDRYGGVERLDAKTRARDLAAWLRSLKGPAVVGWSVLPAVLQTMNPRYPTLGRILHRPDVVSVEGIVGRLRRGFNIQATETEVRHAIERCCLAGLLDAAGAGGDEWVSVDVDTVAELVEKHPTWLGQNSRVNRTATLDILTFCAAVEGLPGADPCWIGSRWTRGGVATGLVEVGGRSLWPIGHPLLDTVARLGLCRAASGPARLVLGGLVEVDLRAVSSGLSRTYPSLADVRRREGGRAASGVLGVRLAPSAVELARLHRALWQQTAASADALTTDAVAVWLDAWLVLRAAGVEDVLDWETHSRWVLMAMRAAEAPVERAVEHETSIPHMAMRAILARFGVAPRTDRAVVPRIDHAVAPRHAVGRIVSPADRSSTSDLYARMIAAARRVLKDCEPTKQGGTVGGFYWPRLP